MRSISVVVNDWIKEATLKSPQTSVRHDHVLIDLPTQLNPITCFRSRHSNRVPAKTLHFKSVVCYGFQAFIVVVVDAAKVLLHSCARFLREQP